MEALPEALRNRFEENGLIYGRHFRDGTITDDWRADPRYRHHSWQYWFDTEDRIEIEQKLVEREINFEWLDDGTLRYWTHRPASIHHPATGEYLSFNQIYAQTAHRIVFGDEYMNMVEIAYGTDVPQPYFVHFGDGKPLTAEEFMTIHEEMERRKVAFQWQKGDVLLLENKLTAHGRHRVKGPREIQTMLFD